MTEPTRPVSEYCDAFRAWAQAIRDNREERWDATRDALFHVELAVAKSNLLYRLIYLGETLRTEPCPEHKGHWSGCTWERRCACQDLQGGGWAYDITGWLP